MSFEKPVIVFAIGAWHTPKHYSKVQTRLEASGFEVVIPAHPSTNEARPPNAGLAEDTAHARAEIEKLVDAGKRVVVIGHSYGGMVATNGLPGLGLESRKANGQVGGVINIIYQSGFALPEGGSMVGFVKQMGHEDRMPIAFNFAEDMTVVCNYPQALIGDYDNADEAEEYVESLKLWNGQAMHDSVSKSAWREIPVTYIKTKNDVIVPCEYQTFMIAEMEAAGRPVKSFEVATGHCAHFTEADAVADVIRQVAV